MASEFSTFHSALSWYSAQLAEGRRMPAAEARRQLEWLREFSDALPRRVHPTDVGQRDVILYFAEHCDDFGDPLEWYYRYKVIENFYEDMTVAFGLPTNQIKGLYDESDLDPDLLSRIPERPRMAPVNWSRDQHDFY